MSRPGPGVRLLLRRLRDEGSPAFVAGWRIDPRTVAAAFRRGLVVEIDTDLWDLTPAGAKVARG